jgi:hypothetical protein
MCRVHVIDFAWSDMFATREIIALTSHADFNLIWIKSDYAEHWCMNQLAVLIPLNCFRPLRWFKQPCAAIVLDRPTWSACGASWRRRTLPEVTQMTPPISSSPACVGISRGGTPSKGRLIVELLPASSYSGRLLCAWTHLESELSHLLYWIVKLYYNAGAEVILMTVILSKIFITYYPSLQYGSDAQVCGLQSIIIMPLTSHQRSGHGVESTNGAELCSSSAHCGFWGVVFLIQRIRNS